MGLCARRLLRDNWARYAGKHFADRHRIKRKVANCGQRYEALPRAAGLAVLAAMTAEAVQETA